MNEAWLTQALRLIDAYKTAPGSKIEAAADEMIAHLRVVVTASPPSKSTKEADIAAIRHTLMTGLGHNLAIAALNRLASSSIKEDGGRPATIPLAGGWGNLTEGKDFERVKEDGERAEPSLPKPATCTNSQTALVRDLIGALQEVLPYLDDGRSQQERELGADVRNLIRQAQREMSSPPSPLGDTPRIPPGWKIERRDSKPFKVLNITAPNGYSSSVGSHERNPMNVLYMLAEALLEGPLGDTPDQQEQKR